MNFLNVTAILFSIISGILSLTQAYLSTNTMKVIGPICLMLAFSTSILIYIGSISIPKIKITSYTTEQIVHDLVKINKDNQVEIFPVQFVTNQKLDNSKEIVLFMRVAGGNEYWISGNPSKKINISEDGTGQVDSVTMGSINDGNVRYELILAVVKNKKYGAGMKLKDIPEEDVICKDQVFLNKKI